MAKKLNLAKVSENLTPRERAKLVISLGLKGIEAIGYKDKPLPTEKDIAQVFSACPPAEASEYNFYIGLKQWVWTRIMPLIEAQLQYLDALEGRIAPLRYALAIAPFVNKSLELVKSQPVAVTQEEYKKAVKESQRQVREEVRELEGNYNLAEQEAFYRLIKEGKIPEDSDETAWTDYISRYGKTEKELVKDVIAIIKNGIEGYQKRRDRTGREPVPYRGWSEYVGLSDRELEEAVRKGRAGELERPAKEEYELWQKTVKEERGRILEATREGKLKWVRRKVRRYNRKDKSWFEEEAEGVELGSYYDWDERHQRYAGEEGAKERGYNPLAEDCLEFRWVENKGVVYANDLSLTEEEEESWSGIVTAAPEDEWKCKGLKLRAVERENIVRLLGALLPVEVGKRDRKKWLKGDETRTIRLSEPELKEALRNFITKATNTANEIHNYITLVETIEEKHFDGMQIVSRDPKNPIGTIGRALVAIRELADSHNSHLKEVVKTFNQVESGLYEFEFENLQELLLNPEPKVNQEWVEEELTEIEEWVKK